ncbi:MAG: HAD hydrolase-like protein, partial [Proteobacteria bacterium]|nr:HAD hydrolase-like protein [Burkholderiales bacterium]
IDAYYYCPHHPDGKVAGFAGTCDCRKPSRGLVDRAVREFGIDPTSSFTVGDRWLDVALARTIGGRGILVRTGYGSREEQRPARSAAHAGRGCRQAHHRSRAHHQPAGDPRSRNQGRVGGDRQHGGGVRARNACRDAGLGQGDPRERNSI